MSEGEFDDEEDTAVIKDMVELQREAARIAAAKLADQCSKREPMESDPG